MLALLLCLLVKLPAQYYNIDSIRQVANHPPNDTADLIALAELASLQRRNPDSLRYFALEAIRRARERELPEWVARMNNSFAGQLAGMAGVELDTALAYNQLAIDFYLTDTVSYRGDLAATYLNRGVFHYMQGDHAGAIEYFEQAYDRMDPVKQARNMAAVMNNLGVLHRVMGDHVAAVRAYEQSIELKETINDSVGIASAQANMGVALMELDRNEEALEVFEAAKTFYENQKMDAASANVELLIGLSYYNRGESATAVNIWEAALANPALEVQQPQNMVQTYVGLADIYQDSSGKLDVAYDYILLANDLRPQLAGNDRLLLSLDYRLGRVYEAKGQLDSATYYLSLYGQSSREIYKEDLLAYEQEMSERFQSRLQTVELERQDAQLAQQQAELTASQQRQIFLTMLALALGVIALIVWVLGRFRARYQRAELARQELIKQQELEELQREGKLNELRSMIEGQEAERRRVAKDLHDGLGGLLTTVKANVGNLRPELTRIESTSLDQAENLIDRACTEVRRIAHNMMPQTLSLAGLSGSLEDIAAQLTTQGLDCDLEITGEPESYLDAAQQSMILRIVQELCQNITKHAAANQVLIQLLRQQQQLLLIVEDNGKGFNEQYVTQTDAGLGLGSIRNRVTFLNGDLLIDSTPKRGTTVTINIPL
ncbi:MAG: tetratricopeptide repeat protein [Bacteroidota bacterium]